MKTLLVMTVGQTDMQLVIDNVRHELSRKCCGELHDELEHRGFVVVDAPKKKQKDEQIETFSDGKLSVCTPKLDAVLRFFGDSLPVHALVFDTRRESPSDPRLAGRVVARRLKERGVQADCCTFLAGKEWLEDRSNEIDAVVRRDIVERLNSAISQKLRGTKFDRIVVAATGGLPAVNDVVEELVRLHAVGRAQITSLEVPDGAFAAQDDRATEEKFHPSSGYRARWHALSLVEKGNLLGAWGAVSHLEDTPGQEWTQVIKWLAQFAASLPLPTDCDLTVLSHQRMAVRAALRVEMALRADDIPRAVHGTVAFFEAALWDGLCERLERSPEPKKRRYFKVVNGNAPSGDKLLRAKDAKDNPSRPFQLKETVDGIDWYWVYDSDGGPGARIAEHFLARKALTAFAKVLATANECDENFYSLRNDVAHTEPTPALMEGARSRMQTAALWSDADTFLSQALAQNILKELGEPCPERLCNDLVSTVRERLFAIP
jgi:hypothetical protein